MKTRVCALPLFAVLLTANAVDARSVAGKWKAEFDTPLGVMKYDYEFKVDGEKLTGKAVRDFDGKKTEVDLVEGKVKGDTLSFVELFRYMDTEIQFEYTGKIKGDEIAFTRKDRDFATFEVVAKRLVNADKKEAPRTGGNAPPVEKETKAAKEIALYPGAAPGSEKWDWSERFVTNPKGLPMVQDVVRPVLLHYPADKGKAVGTAMIVAPGGGFRVLMMSYEGVDIARRLNAMGIDAFVLKYRLIHNGPGAPPAQEVIKLAAEDGRQAVRLVRKRAGDYGVRPDRVGMIGFSAGGIVTSEALFGPAETRPDFAAIIYGAPREVKEVPSPAPPLFLAVAADDAMAVGRTIDLFTAYRKAKGLAELHVFQMGGHGFPNKGGGADRFMDRLEEWLRPNKLLAKSANGGAPGRVLPLWPGAAPGSEGWTQKEVEYRNEWDKKTMVRNVTTPTLTAYLPDPAVATGAAIVICPGGGFRFLSWQSEGTEVAQWLQARGVAAFVLKYRLVETAASEEEFRKEMAAFLGGLARRKDKPATDTPSKREATKDQGKPDEASRPALPESMRKIGALAIADGRQALKAVRQHAAEWGIKKDRVGIMGFSAGGMVTMGAVMSDDADSRPDFAAPIYGGGTGGAKVPKDAPPLFILCAADDRLAATGSARLYSEWKAAGLPAELHIYEKGGHGFGMTPRGLPVDRWIERYGDWLQTRGLIKVAAPRPKAPPPDVGR